MYFLLFNINSQRPVPPHRLLSKGRIFGPTILVFEALCGIHVPATNVRKPGYSGYSGYSHIASALYLTAYIMSSLDVPPSASANNLKASRKVNLKATRIRFGCSWDSGEFVSYAQLWCIHLLGGIAHQPRRQLNCYILEYLNMNKKSVWI